MKVLSVCTYCGKQANSLNMCDACRSIYKLYTSEKHKCKRGNNIVPSKLLMDLQSYYMTQKQLGFKVPREFQEVTVHETM